MDAKLFNSDPRNFALEMVSNGLVSADHLLLCALKYMSHDDVRDMLDSNELSPRFDEDEEEAEEEEKINSWLDEWDDGYHDIEAMRIDIANNNLEVGDDDRAAEYEYEAIVALAIRQRSQVRLQLITEKRIMYTEEQLAKGEGLSESRAMLAFTYDGRTWGTCELSDSIGGEPIEVCTVPPTSRGGWDCRA